MEMTEWFDLSVQKPWEPGVYEVMSIHGRSVGASYWNGSFFGNAAISGAAGENMVNASRWMSFSRDEWDFGIYLWRGISSNPSKPKSKGNPKKTMYVVMYDKTPLAAMDTRKQCLDYVKRGNIWWTSIEKIRFRTPERGDAT